MIQRKWPSEDLGRNPHEENKCKGGGGQERWEDVIGDKVEGKVEASLRLQE